MNGELLGIEVMTVATVWALGIPAAFIFIGPVAGIAVIFAGLAILGWWLTIVVRGSTPPCDESDARTLD